MCDVSYREGRACNGKGGACSYVPGTGGPRCLRHRFATVTLTVYQVDKTKSAVPTESYRNY